jgi:outer membrane lipoprotein SlyB
MKAMKALRVGVVLLVTLMSGCATTDTTSTTWTEPGAPGYGSPYPPPPGYVRGGQVQSVQEVVQRTQGQPGAGAVAGALIGGFLFGGHGPGSALAGAAGGAAVGAAASSGSSETRTYHVLVRFDDGGYGTFVYAGYSPFGPGERVMLTPQGLARG